MTWKECKSHSSIFYDNSVHEDCPECLNEKLKSALKMLNDLNQDNLRFDVKLLEWMEGELGRLNMKGQTDHDASKRESEKAEIFAFLEKIQKNQAKARSFLSKNNLTSLL